MSIPAGHQPNLPVLTDADHDNLDRFLGVVLDAHASRRVTREDAIASIAQVIGALDKRNVGEVRTWLQNPETFVLR